MTMRHWPAGWFTIAVDYDEGYIETRFDDGTVCRGSHVGNDPEQYAATARRAGYGEDVKRMAVENDLLHTFLSTRAGMPFSPALWGTAHRRWWPWWEAEEAAVYGLQCLLHGGNVEQWHWDALGLYARWCRPSTNIESLVAEATEWLSQVEQKAA